MITAAQAEAISEILDCGFGDESGFVPRDVFPELTLRDVSGRRAIKQLDAKRLLGRIPVRRHDDRPSLSFMDRRYRLTIMPATLEAFRAYADSVEYEFPWEK